MQSTFVLVLSLVGLATSSLGAQTTNLFEIYPDEAGTALTFTSRYTLGSEAGENLIQVPSLYSWVGDNKLGGGESTINGYRGAHQDENASTQSDYFVVLRKESSSGGPDPAPAGVIARYGPFKTAPNQPAKPVAWLITMSLTSPLVVPTKALYYFGIEHAKAPSWPSDGMSTHIAHYFFATAGDNPRTGAPNLAYTIAPNRTPQVEQPSGRTARIGLLVEAPLLGVGGVDPNNTRQSPKGSPNYGAGGLWPDILGKSTGRFDDIEIRFSDAANPSGFAILFANFALSPVPFTFANARGTFALSLVQPILLGLGPTALDAKGKGKRAFPLGPGNGSLRTLLGGKKLYWQSFNLDLTLKRFALSNVGAHGF
ncbi:MAG: hypothetical protein ACE5F1_12040 [Planctomycetota bacterium]